MKIVIFLVFSTWQLETLLKFFPIPAYRNLTLQCLTEVYVAPQQYWRFLLIIFILFFKCDLFFFFDFTYRWQHFNMGSIMVQSMLTCITYSWFNCRFVGVVLVPYVMLCFFFTFSICFYLSFSSLYLFGFMYNYVGDY